MGANTSAKMQEGAPCECAFLLKRCLSAGQPAPANEGIIPAGRRRLRMMTLTPVERGFASVTVSGADVGAGVNDSPSGQLNASVPASSRIAACVAASRSGSDIHG